MKFELQELELLRDTIESVIDNGFQELEITREGKDTLRDILKRVEDDIDIKYTTLIPETPEQLIASLRYCWKYRPPNPELTNSLAQMESNPESYVINFTTIYTWFSLYLKLEKLRIKDGNTHRLEEYKEELGEFVKNNKLILDKFKRILDHLHNLVQSCLKK